MFWIGLTTHPAFPPPRSLRPFAFHLVWFAAPGFLYTWCHKQCCWMHGSLWRLHDWGQVGFEELTRTWHQNLNHMSHSAGFKLFAEVNIFAQNVNCWGHRRKTVHTLVWHVAAPRISALLGVTSCDWVLNLTSPQLWCLQRIIVQATKQLPHLNQVTVLKHVFVRWRHNHMCIYIDIRALYMFIIIVIITYMCVDTHTLK